MKSFTEMSDRQQKNIVDQFKRRRDVQLQADLAELLRCDWGRRLAYWLIHDLGELQAGVFNGSIKDGGSSAQHMAYRDGRRAMAIDLHEALMRASPSLVLAMTTEHIRSVEAELQIEHTQHSDEAEQ